MNSNFEGYNIRKEKLLELLSEAKSFYDNNGDEKISSSISDNIDVINSGEFEVVVVGEFSAGKSTFLNALMGEKFLPSYTRETTATINYLRNVSESEKKGIVYYMDGHTEVLEEIDGETVERYVSTKNKEMDVSKTVKHLDLYLDSPFLKNKVTLIDSPGLNGMKEGLGEITDAQIKRSHAVIFMFSAEQPGKRSDFEYLKKVKDEVNTVFLVLNKIDCIKQSENQTVEDTIDNLISSYKEVFPKDTSLPEVIPIAAYPALVARSNLDLDYPSNHFGLTKAEKEELERKSLMKEFEEKLRRFLTNGEKTIMQLKEPLARLQSDLERSAERIRNELGIIENERDALELENQIIEVEKAIQMLETEIGNQRSDIRRAIKMVERDIFEYMNVEVENVSRKANARVDQLQSIEILEDETAEVNRNVNRAVKELVEKLDIRFREMFFEQVQEQYANIIFKLEEQLENVEIQSLNFDVHINVTANEIHAGLENFNTMKEGLEEQILQLESAMEEDGRKEDELIEMSATADFLKSKYERIQQTQSELQSSFCPPEVEVRVKTGTRSVERQGIGKILDFILGERTEEYSYDEKDTSERTAYIKEYRERRSQLSSEAEELEKSLHRYLGVDKKIDRIVREREERQKKLQRLREKEDTMKKEFNEELNKKYDQEVIRIKAKMKQQIGDRLDDVRPTLKNILKENRNTYTTVLQDLLEQSIGAQLALKKQENENLKELRQKANENKEEMMNLEKEKEKIVSDLLGKCKMLFDEIDNIEVEKREYRTI